MSQCHIFSHISILLGIAIELNMTNFRDGSFSDKLSEFLWNFLGPAVDPCILTSDSFASCFFYLKI